MCGAGMRGVNFVWECARAAISKGLPHVLCELRGVLQSDFWAVLVQQLNEALSLDDQLPQ